MTSTADKSIVFATLLTTELLMSSAVYSRFVCFAFMLFFILTYFVFSDASTRNESNTSSVMLLSFSLSTGETYTVRQVGMYSEEDPSS